MALHIDNGLMRKNESEDVMKQLQSLGINVKHINAGLRFYNSTTTLYDKHNKTKERKVSYNHCSVVVFAICIEGVLGGILILIRGFNT